MPAKGNAKQNQQNMRTSSYRLTTSLNLLHYLPPSRYHQRKPRLSISNCQTQPKVAVYHHVTLTILLLLSSACLLSIPLSLTEADTEREREIKRTRQNTHIALVVIGYTPRQHEVGVALAYTGRTTQAVVKTKASRKCCHRTT